MERIVFVAVLGEDSGLDPVEGEVSAGTVGKKLGSDLCGIGNEQLGDDGCLGGGAVVEGDPAIQVEAHGELVGPERADQGEWRGGAVDVVMQKPALT